jgi:hypothetical protein
MKNLLVGGGLALGLGLATVAGAAPPDPAKKGSVVTITGCVAGSDSDSFVLTHVQKVATDGTPIPNAPPSLGATGMEGGAGEVIYWLSKDSVKKMRGHVGHQVEVTGPITDVSMGSVKVRQEPGKEGRDNKVEVDARGKEASARTERPVEPGPPPAPGTRVEEKKTLPTYRIQVETVRMVAETCP